MIEPINGKIERSHQKTKVKFAYDDSGIYIGAELNDQNVLDYYEFLLDSIMEFYFMLLLIDDEKRITLVSASSDNKSIKSQKKTKKEVSTIVAETLAKKAQEKNITKVYFDRGIYKYHGRVKVFAETLRKNGMKV